MQGQAWHILDPASIGSAPFISAVSLPEHHTTQETLGVAILSTCGILLLVEQGEPHVNAGI